ncbi:lipopolysaccharide biosynthesis protein [Maribacter sp. M208]|uniref:lipopolysaccharide biosynthesis protein n=1 Tax=Maribacter huludaoensis TaxID=3030010 RepID=UPI0023ECF8CD|nr:lipopolysaccharide biosynthesis protein [Maribacter huludaoensis]MDF4222880.1 lipopolysaccharide biosynthesis protein [Maribacter huludaoensis]
MELGNKIFKGAIWSVIEKLSVQVISFALGIVLARLLTPSEYGTFGLLIVFITISQVFIDSGFSQALIQTPNRNQKDISTVLTFNIIVALVCYFLLFVGAPFVADFYEITELKNLLRVVAFSLIINSMFSVPSTLLTIEMNFRLLAKITFISTLISGILAIIAAYSGLGVWALVLQVLLKGIISTILFWISIKSIPKIKFYNESFRKLFSFGSKLLISNLLANILSNLNSILIGKYIGTKELGFYTRGTQFTDMAYNVINSSINSVLLPSLSTVQNDVETLVSYCRTLLKITTLVTVPIFLCLAIFSEPLILLLLSEKWAMAIPIMQIFCIARMITISIGISSNMLYVVGRTDLSLKQEYFKIAVRVIFLLLALPYGIYYIALAELASTTSHFFINNYFPRKLFNYGSKKQLLDILKILLSGVLMTIIGFFFMKLFDQNIFKILFTTPIVIFVYISCIKIFKVDEFNLLLEKIKSLKK